jgi:hypothetical protein
MSMCGALGLPALIVSIGISWACVIVAFAYAKKLNAEAVSALRSRAKERAVKRMMQ